MSDAIKTIPLAIVGDAAPSLTPGAKQVAGDKIARSPVQFADAPVLRKPSWIRVRLPSGNAVATLKAKLRENRLVTVCEEASCPNIHVRIPSGNSVANLKAKCARTASSPCARKRAARTSTSASATAPRPS